MPPLARPSLRPWLLLMLLFSYVSFFWNSSFKHYIWLDCLEFGKLKFHLELEFVKLKFQKTCYITK